MRGFNRSVALAATLLTGCSGDVVGEGSYPVELFLGVGARMSSLNMDECTYAQLNAYVRFEGDAPQTGDYAYATTFESSDPSIAFVGNGLTPSPDGLYYASGGLIALKPGLVTITAHYLTFSATLAVQVAELSDLRIEPVLTDIAQDLPQKFDLIARFSQARPEQDASDTAVWSFEPSTPRAAVDEGGEVHANSSRDDAPVTLVARLPECGRTATQSFRISPIQSVELEYEFPDDANMILGTSEVLRLYARFAGEGTTRQNISRSAEIQNLPDDYITASVVTNTPPTNIREVLNPVDIGDDLLVVRALEDEGDVAFDVHVDSGETGFDLRTRTWSLVETAVEDLQIIPEEINVRYPDRRRLRAIASFSNGMSRDISREATWTSLAETWLAVSNELDDAGMIESANVDQDAEVQAVIESDGEIHSDLALIHIYSADSSTPSTDP